MTITITDGATSIDLPFDLLWIDQHSWSPVEQKVATSITGAAIIDAGTRLNGRPVTLEGDERHAWMPYSTVQQLKAWAAVADQQLTLIVRGVVMQVMFRHQDRPAVDVRPLLDYAAPDAADFFYGSLKFMEI